MSCKTFGIPVLFSISIIFTLAVVLYLPVIKTSEFIRWESFVKELENSRTYEIKLNKTEIQNKNRLNLLDKQCKLTGYDIRQQSTFRQLASSRIIGNPINFLTGAVYVKDGFHEKPENIKNVVLCAPAKTGTSSWRTGIMSMYHLNYTVQDQENGKIQPNSSLATLPDIKSLLNRRKLKNSNHLKFGNDLESSEPLPNLLKILHVRHPFRRIYSAWADKFFDYDKSLDFYEKFFRKYQKIADESIQFYETERSLKIKTVSKSNGVNTKYIVSFQAFLKWIVSGKGFRTYSNAHWSPMYEYCNVCGVKYDVITKLETIELDMELVLARLGAVGNFSLPRLNRKNWDDNLKEEEEAGEKIHENLDFDTNLIVDFHRAGIDEVLLKSLYLVYQNDFKFFGYDYQIFSSKYSLVEDE